MSNTNDNDIYSGEGGTFAALMQLRNAENTNDTPNLTKPQTTEATNPRGNEPTKAQNTAETEVRNRTTTKPQKNGGAKGHKNENTKPQRNEPPKPHKTEGAKPLKNIRTKPQNNEKSGSTPEPVNEETKVPENYSPTPRTIKRHSFALFPHQVEQIENKCLDDIRNGGRGLKGSLFRDILDAYIQKHREGTNPRGNEATRERTHVATNPRGNVLLQEMVKASYDIYTDQLQEIRIMARQLSLRGNKLGVYDIVREAIDQYFDNSN